MRLTPDPALARKASDRQKDRELVAAFNRAVCTLVIGIFAIMIFGLTA